MPQFGIVSLANGAATHSFVPRGIDQNGVATLVESTGVPIGDRRLTVQRSRTSAGREKVTIKMTLPVVQSSSENGISRPTVVRTAYADVTFSFDGGSSVEERAEMRTLIANFLSGDSGPADEIIDDLESLF